MRFVKKETSSKNFHHVYTIIFELWTLIAFISGSTNIHRFTKCMSMIYVSKILILIFLIFHSFSFVPQIHTFILTEKLCIKQQMLLNEQSNGTKWIISKRALWIQLAKFLYFWASNIMEEHSNIGNFVLHVLFIFWYHSAQFNPCWEVNNKPCICVDTYSFW